MKKTIVKSWRTLVTFLFSLIGVTACSEKAMYGCPHADLTIKAEVTDAATQQPVKNIRVVIASGTPDLPLQPDTLYTDDSGKAEITRYGETFFGDTPDLVVKFEDIDDTENGYYAPMELSGKDLTVKQTKNGKDWYKGAFDITAKAELQEDIPPVR